MFYSQADNLAVGGTIVGAFFLIGGLIYYNATGSDKSSKYEI